MPRSSRHKSHKQSKHSSKDAKDYLSDSEEDLKMKERNNAREEGTLVRASKESSDLSSGEKRKLSSSFQSKEGKDLSHPRNGDASEEYASSNRRKDLVEGISGGSDRWTAGGDEKYDSGVMEKAMRGESVRIDSEKGLKSREPKGSSDLKSKGRRHEIVAEKEERNVAAVLKGKEEENKSGNTRGDSKRKSEKDSGRREGRDSKDTKEKERVSDRDSKKVQGTKQESGARDNVGDDTKKHDMYSGDADKDRPAKRAKENSVLGIVAEVHNLEIEKELGKRISRRREESGDRDGYPDVRENDDRHVSSKSDHAKDGKYKDERYKSKNHGEKYLDNKEKGDSHRDDKYREHVGGDRDSRHKNDKYRDDSERESRRREDRYRDDGDVDSKCRGNNERDVQSKDEKYRDDKDIENKRRDDKYPEDGKDSRRDGRYYEDGERDDRLKDERYREKNDRHKEDKSREDYERDSEHRDGRHGDDFDREKRVREAKYRDDRSFRDRFGDKYEAKNLREETQSSELHHRTSSIRENSPSYDDRAQLKVAQGRKRASDRDDYNDMRLRGFKDQRSDVEKGSTGDVRIDLATDRGRSGSRYVDVEATSNWTRHRGSSSSLRATGDQYRLLKQDELKHREYAYEERFGHGVTSARDYGSAAGITDRISSSRSSEKVIPKDDVLIGEASAERHSKADIRNSPRHLVAKSPSSTSTDRTQFGRSDFRRSDDVEAPGPRSGCLKEVKKYSCKEGRGTLELASESCPGDEPSQGDGDTISISSPFARNSHQSSSSKSFSHPPPHPFRVGDSPQAFRSAEDDGRMKSGKRHRRNGDPNTVRVQGSPWKGLANWSSPMANGFMPFQHGPAIGFHPAMQQFPAASIIGLRPSMELNHPGVPYPIPDGERFSHHGRNVGWRTVADDPCPPQLHGWEVNYATIGGESLLSGRQEWPHDRTLQGVRPWETGGESWKSSKPVASFELPPASEKERNQCSHGPDNLTPPNQSSELGRIEQSNHSVECIDASHSSDIADKIVPDNSDIVPQATSDVLKASQTNDTQLCRVYLSMLDVSADLSDPALYKKYKDLMSVEEKELSDLEDGKILYVEVAEAKEMSPSKISNGLLFPAIEDSLLQKAMSLYRNQKEESVISRGEHALSSAGGNESAKKQSSTIYKEAEEVKSVIEEIHPDGMDVKGSIGQQNFGDISLKPNHNLDEAAVTKNMEKSEDKAVSKQEDGGNDSKGQEHAVANPIPIDTEEASSGGFRGRAEMVIPPSDSLSNRPVDQNEDNQNLPVTKYGSLLLSSVPSMARGVDVPELTSGTLNLRRIHHSPESTH